MFVQVILGRPIHNTSYDWNRKKLFFHCLYSTMCLKRANDEI